jgi:hypothetical protein
MARKRTASDGGRDGAGAWARESLDGSAASELLLTLGRFERAHRLRSTTLMRTCFCEDALIESVASNGRMLGPDETVEAIGEALRDGVYVIDDWRYETLVGETVLSTTRARHRLPSGAMRDEMVHRLVSGREGLMWRVRLFAGREAALAHFDRHGPGLGL